MIRKINDVFTVHVLRMAFRLRVGRHGVVSNMTNESLSDISYYNYRLSQASSLPLCVIIVAGFLL